jgi:hypothetical protein
VRFRQFARSQDYASARPHRIDGEPAADEAPREGGMADDAVIGQVGTVLVRVRGGDLPGEIATTVRGTRETLIAFADAPLERGMQVLVVAIRGPRQVDVVAWSS